MTGRQHEARRHGRSSSPLAPSQGCEQETTSAGMTGRWHEAGRHGSVPLLSLPVRDASRRRHLTRGYLRGRAPWLSSPPLAPSQGCEQETTFDRMTGQRHEAGRHGRGSPPLPPSQGCMQETRLTGMTGRWHEAGHHGSVPLLSLPVKDASRRQHLTGATARGRVPLTRRPSSRSQSVMRAGATSDGMTG